MKKGFTLAEVLVTLAVIGVVAALAIPALIQNTNDTQYKVAWKKAFSDLNQASKSIMTDNGSTLKQAFTSSDQMMGLYQEKMNTVKTCLNADGTDACWPNNTILTALNGTPGGIGTHAATILNNGNLVNFQFINTDCNGGSSWVGTPNGKLVCGIIRIDINGFKGPNVIGKDVFAAWVQDDRLAPLGTPGDLYPAATTCLPGTAAPGSGWGCSSKYLYDK